MTFNPNLAKAFQAVTTGGVATGFFGIFQGRCTFAAICFAVAGIYGWLHGRDLTSFALFITAEQGLLILHSWKEDVKERQRVQKGDVGAQ